jgi:hypothetical protein
MRDGSSEIVDDATANRVQGRRRSTQAPKYDRILGVRRAMGSKELEADVKVGEGKGGRDDGVRCMIEEHCGSKRCLAHGHR